MALANHHDNFDNSNSKFQPWNSVNVGLRKDLIGEFAAAARKNGLRFGVSVHGSRAWRLLKVAEGADANGPLAGVPCDGKLTKADGKGLWWDGLDPQNLYAQNHARGAKMDAAYCEKFYLARNNCETTTKWHGQNEAVVNTKRLHEVQRRALAYDVERGKSDSILPEPWQTDTFIGQWHYNRETFEKHQYETSGGDPHVGGHREQEWKLNVERAAAR